MKRIGKQARRSLLSETDTSLKRALLPSTGLHVFLLGALVLPGLWGISLPGCSPRDPRPRFEEPIFMVEAVALPKSKRMPRKAAAPPPVEKGKEGTKVEPPVNEQQKVLPTPDVPEKAGAKIEEEPEEKPKEKPKKKPKTREDFAMRTEEVASSVVFEDSPEGEEDAPPKPPQKGLFDRPMTAYERLVRDQVQDRWEDSRYRGQKLEAIYRIELDSNGNITGYSLEKSSGNRVFDKSCQRAIRTRGRVKAPGPKDNKVFHIAFNPGAQ